jgi:Tfp pilus assembly protein PilF
MEKYYTIDEKYLQAVNELNYGETPLSLKLLNEILEQEPAYVRAHYQIGVLFYYDLRDYQAAGYHFKLCTELDATFPDVYFHYISLLVFLNMEKQVYLIAQKALLVPGVYKAAIYNLMGLCAETNLKFNAGRNYYNMAMMQVTSNDKKKEVEENLERIHFKLQLGKAYRYELSVE